jgi:hypothetical protein
LAPLIAKATGRATVSRDDPLPGETVGAQLMVRVAARAIFPNCPRYIPMMQQRMLLQDRVSPGAEVVPAESRRCGKSRCRGAPGFSFEMLSAILFSET